MGLEQYTQKECVRFDYSGKAKVIVIDTELWDYKYLNAGSYYCASLSKWEKLIVVTVKEYNGLIDYTVTGYGVERKRKIKRYMQELTWLLRKAKTAEDIEELVKLYVYARKALLHGRSSLTIMLNFKGEKLTLTLF